MNAPRHPPQSYPARRSLLLGLLGVVALLLAGRALDLHVFHRAFLQYQGDARHLRVVPTAAHRGMITDRHGEPLAISTPVDSVWANPAQLLTARERWPALAALLKLSPAQLAQRLEKQGEREFVYLKRRINPDLGQQIMALGLAGVSLQREYRRYYPAGEVTAHVLGVTDVDDNGQEGIELGFDKSLRGIPGARRVLKDRLGRIVEDVQTLAEPRPGQDLQLSLDRGIQYLAYRELLATVEQHQAKSGSVVLLDVHSGEVLAMVNLPAYNPNKSTRPDGSHRNRALTDVFEPGSTIKTFTVAAGLESGKYRADTAIDTTPGRFQVGRKTIRDTHNYGLIDVSTVIQKSSNIGATKIALSIPAEDLWLAFSQAGLGSSTGSGFPGEVGGSLAPYGKWRQIEHATLSFGYGLSVTALQLAQAYAAVANNGQLHPVTFIHGGSAKPARQIMQAQTAATLRTMLERVTNTGGTATQARVPGYRVAGKTGTVHKLGPGGYLADRYLSLFAGFAPASNPRLALVVVINEPNGRDYYGGLVAAPVFSRVMSGALRVMGVAPDDLSVEQPTLLMAAGALPAVEQIPPASPTAAPAAADKAAASARRARVDERSKKSDADTLLTSRKDRTKPAKIARSASERPVKVALRVAEQEAHLNRDDSPRDKPRANPARDRAPAASANKSTAIDAIMRASNIGAADSGAEDTQ